MKYIYLYLLSVVVLLQSCSSSKMLQRNLATSNSNYFTGLLVYNPINSDTIINYNATKYFTPASTVKLFTLYTALKTLPDSIASIAYLETNDTLFFKTLADPSFLHDSLPNSSFEFLKKSKKNLVYVSQYFDDFIYGDGWQWDDYQYYYMPEKNIFPIYGNLALLKGDKIIPNFFQNQLKETKKPEIHRDFSRNIFYKDTILSDKTRLIPFKTSISLAIQLLQDTLHKPIGHSTYLKDKKFTTYTSTPTQPLYKRLMDESENFIAEQLFLYISKNKTDEFRVKNTINYALDSLFQNIPNNPRWVDASGLSRYNIFTPKSMVYVLDKMYKDFGRETTLNLLPRNGKGGSLQKWYPADTTYLYAKTGSLSNNHSICGFLITKKGSLLIFSYMNNNYTKKSSEVRGEMNTILQQIYNEE